MANEFTCPHRIHLASFDGDQDGFNYHCQMATMTILVAIKFNHHCPKKKLKRGEFDKPPLCLF
jgi:hypothetical protein